MRANSARSGFLALAIAAAASLAACSGERDQVDTALADAVGALDAAVDSAAGRLAGREYSNAELTGFINAYNDAEIELGEIAATKATDTQVRDFARRVVSEHRALKTSVTNTASTLNITPGAPEDDENLAEDHQAGMRDLQAMPRGRDFDRAYIDHEIKMHRKVLDEIEDAIGRNRNTEISTLLENARTGVRGHLDTAEQLRQRLSA
jgi:putative membrane protein